MSPTRNTQSKIGCVKMSGQGKRILFINSLVSLIKTTRERLNFSLRSLKLVEK
jgi:hypothetical protein